MKKDKDRPMRKKFRIILIFVITFFGILVFRDHILKSIITITASKVTGAPVRIGSFSLSFVSKDIRVFDFKMFNPRGFPSGVLVDIPRLAAILDSETFFKGQIHLKQLDVEIKEIGLTKNKAGKLNIDSLEISEENSQGIKKQAMKIDLLNLAIGKVVNKNYAAGEPALIKVYDLNLKKSYRNITSMEQLAILVITEPLKSAGIKGLKVYGVAMLSGVAFLPVAAAFTFTGKDFTSDTLDTPFEKAYLAGLKALQGSGQVKKENRQAGAISAAVNGASVVLKLRKLGDNSTRVTISARKFGFPRPEIASGVLYRLMEELK